MAVKTGIASKELYTSI